MLKEYLHIGLLLVVVFTNKLLHRCQLFAGWDRLKQRMNNSSTISSGDSFSAISLGTKPDKPRLHIISNCQMQGLQRCVLALVSHAQIVRWLERPNSFRNIPTKRARSIPWRPRIKLNGLCALGKITKLSFPFCCLNDRIQQTSTAVASDGIVNCRTSASFPSFGVAESW